MGLLSALWGRDDAMPAETRAAPAETRASTSDSFAHAAGIWASGGPESALSAAQAEGLSTVGACVGAIASGIASLPARIYRTTAAGRTELPHHPAARLFRGEGSRLPWPDLAEWLVSQVLLNGNGLLRLETDDAGRVVGLVPIPWGQITPRLLSGHRLAFDCVETTGAYGAASVPRRLLETEVLHLRDRSDDGILGRSRISRAGEAVSNAASLQRWTAATWQNQATPSGAVKVPAALSDSQFDRLKAQVQANLAGTQNARKVLLLDNGATFEAMAVSPEDAEVLASRRFSVEEICRVFNVPPPIVQAYEFNTFTNAAQASLWFASNTLAPWCRKIEAAFARSVFLPTEADLSLELDLSGLMRGDYSARWQANVAAVGAGILTADEVREQEGFNPLPAAPPAESVESAPPESLPP
jgi:HK97 family phage portal protein